MEFHFQPPSPMRTNMSRSSLAKIEAALKHHGILMLADASFPSVAALIVGEPIKGSWWGHPKGNEIFNSTNELCVQ